MATHAFMKSALVIGAFAFSALASPSALAGDTIHKHCQAARSQGLANLGMVSIVESATELMELYLSCSESIDTGKFRVSPVLKLHVLEGSLATAMEIRPSRFSITSKPAPQGSLEVTLAAETDDGQGQSSTWVTRAFLAVDSTGHPIMIKDHFGGLQDPAAMTSPGEPESKYASGSYINFSPRLARRLCVASGDMSQTFCKRGRAEIARSILADSLVELDFGFPTSLGWKAGKRPTNVDLESKAGRMNFSAALKEVAEDNKGFAFTPDELSKLIRQAAEKIAALEN